MSELEKIGNQEQRQFFISNQERKVVIYGADLRRNSQKIKVFLLNLKTPDDNTKIEDKYQRDLLLVKKEIDGGKILSTEELGKELEQKEKKIREAEMMAEIAPNYSQYLYAYFAKLEQLSGKNFHFLYQRSQDLGKKTNDIPKITPSSLLAEAIAIGIQKREIAKAEIPSMEQIAKAVLEDEELLKDYALVLSENQREEFLNFIPENKRKRIENILDIEVSKVLHQSLVEKGTVEEEQRRMVRMRIFKELQSVLSDPVTTGKKIAKNLAKAFGEIGEDTRQLLLELIRDQKEPRQIDGENLSVHLPRVLKVMLDNFDDWRANDIVLHLATEDKINSHLSVYLLGKLVERGYLTKDVGEWWESEGVVKDKKYGLEIIKKTVSDLGVIPSREVLEFIASDKNWQEQGTILTLPERIDKIKNSQKEFNQVENSRQLIQLLTGDENQAMLYYLLYGGEDRFNLINNYDFAKFQEMIKQIARFEIHQKPLRMFEEALVKSGLSKKETEEIKNRLCDGKFPLSNQNQSYQEVSFDISENAALNNANLEIGAVLGKDQLGVVLAFPIYREYLELIKDNNEKAKRIIETMPEATTFVQRRNLIDKIEQVFPDFKERLKKDLEDNWIKFRGKMLIELTLDQVLLSEKVPISGQELLPKIDARRIDLKRINKDILVALKGENLTKKNLLNQIDKKKKARFGLVKGLESQRNETKKTELENIIKKIDEEIKEIEGKIKLFGELKIDERFNHLSKEEKEVEIDRLSKEIIALTEKSPSAIFTYIAMQVLGEVKLRESDVGLIQEMESHLQGPFQTIGDLSTYERGKDKSIRMRLGLEYLDKKERLMNTVRFADSKICCFSSNNYEQRIQHDAANKEWVASINADPLSFVVSLEIPQEKTEDKRKIKENIGFIFGSFAVDSEGKLGIMLNGIYYAPGIENKLQVQEILNGVEKIFQELPIATIAIASQYGGGAVGEKLPKEYSNQAIELIRLRALDDGSGNPENKIYDDLNTGGDLNKLHFYGGNVWHKTITEL